MEAYSFVIARHTVWCHLAIMNMFMKRLRACKNIVHAWYPMWIMNSEDAGVCGIVFLTMLEKSVFDTQFVTCYNMKQVFTSGVASWDTMWSKYLHVFLASARAYPCVGFTTHDNICIYIDGV